MTLGDTVIRCLTCGNPLRYSGGVDANIPWVHEHNHNECCDVDVPEDAVMFAGTSGRPFANPGPDHFDSFEEYMFYLDERDTDDTVTYPARRKVNMSNRYCFHADESFYNQATFCHQVVRIVEGESGYTPVMEHIDLEFCRQNAKAMNLEHGLSDEDVLDIRTSSMRQHDTESQHTFTVYYVGETLDEALDGFPWDNSDDAERYRQDESGGEWKIWSITARLDLSTAEEVTK